MGWLDDFQRADDYYLTKRSADEDLPDNYWFDQYVGYTSDGQDPRVSIVSNTARQVLTFNSTALFGPRAPVNAEMTQDFTQTVVLSFDGTPRRFIAGLIAHSSTRSNYTYGTVRVEVDGFDTTYLYFGLGRVGTDAFANETLVAGFGSGFVTPASDTITFSCIGAEYTLDYAGFSVTEDMTTTHATSSFPYHGFITTSKWANLNAAYGELKTIFDDYEMTTIAEGLADSPDVAGVSTSLNPFNPYQPVSYPVLFTPGSLDDPYTRYKTIRAMTRQFNNLIIGA